jgi:hypothetical protein
MDESHMKNEFAFSLQIGVEKGLHGIAVQNRECQAG